MHHAMNHVGFMISPELYVVQDKVHGMLCTLRGTGRHFMHYVECMASPELNVVRGAKRCTTWGTWLALNLSWFMAWLRAPKNLRGKFYD